MKKEVLVLFKTHLDMGFTDLAENVVAQYLTKSIPRAIEVGYALRGTDTPFIWTLGSWMVWKALEEDKTGRVEQAIKDGILTWHALPFTTHTELMSGRLFDEGLRISAELDARFGKKTVGSKMTDVPGHTIGMVPHLARHGVKFLHLGVNPATPLPDVPPLFRWKNGEDEVVVLYQKDYGLAEEFRDFVLCFAHTGDNLGPQSPEDVIAVYDHIRRAYPGLPVRAATLDDVASHVCAYDDLPVITDEIGDTWIHGAGTDPGKIASYRALLRRLENTTVDTRALWDNLLVIPEHTCGLDSKKGYPHHEGYTWREMQEKIEKNDADALRMMASWDEQCSYARKAEAILGRDETDVAPSFPDLSVCEKTEAAPPKISLVYQLFGREDYERYETTYMRCHEAWALDDFTKIGLPNEKGGSFEAVCRDAYREENGTVWFDYRFEENVADELGLPRFAVSVKDGLYTVLWQGKKPSRLAQAFWFRIEGLADEHWQIGKMDSWVDADRVIDAKLIAATPVGVRNDAVRITPLDSCLVAPYGRKLLQYKTEPSPQELWFCLYDTVWNTNFPLWYSDDAAFRFVVEKR